MPPVTKVQTPEEDGNRKRPRFRSFSVNVTPPVAVHVLPTPLSFKPMPPLNLDDESRVDVEKREGAGRAAAESGRLGVGIMTLLDRDEDDESIGSPI